MGKHSWWLSCTIILLLPISMIGSHPSITLVFDILCLIACMLATFSGRIFAGKRFILPLTLPFILISAYFILQTIPLSPEALKTLVPGTWKNYQETIWRLSPGIWMPISNHVESTVYAWLHICSLWALCLALGLLVDSHWRLFQLVKIFSLSVTLWSILIIVNALDKQLFGWLPRSNEHIINQYSVALGHWIVVFLPLLFAGYAAFRSHATHLTFMGRFKSFLRNPELSPKASIIVGLCLSSACLLLLFVPVLWLTVLTGYLLFLSLKPIMYKEQYFVHKRVVQVLACLCAISLFAWISSTPLLSQYIESIMHTSLPDSPFPLFGHGIDANYTNRSVGWSTKTIVSGGGFVDIWTGLGPIGAFLMLLAMLALYHGVGGREGLNKSDQMTAVFHAGGIVSLILLFITGSFVSLWRWNSMSTAIICLTFFVTCCRRVSNLMAGEGKHVVSKQTFWILRFCICTLLTTSVFVTVLNAGSGLFAKYTFSYTPDTSVSYDRKDGEGLWHKALSVMLLFNSRLSLDIGQQYLIQKRDLEARSAILSALRLQPLSPQAHVATAIFSACVGDETTSQKFFSTKIAMDYVPDSSTEHLVARLLGEHESEAGIKLINLVLEHSPQLASLYLNLMTLYNYDPLTLKSFLPEHPFVMLAIGDLLLSRGYNEEAEGAYWAAVYNKTDESSQNEMLYIHIARHFATSDRLSEAILVAKEGSKSNPSSLRLKVLTEELNAQTGL